MSYIMRDMAFKEPKRPQATRNYWQTYADGRMYTLVNNRVVWKRAIGTQQPWHEPVVSLPRGIVFNGTKDGSKLG